MLIHFRGKSPKIHPSCFVAPNSIIVGDVEIGELSNIWFNAVIRGDFDSILIGSKVSIQDNAVIHTDPGFTTQIGDGVTIGHGALLHSCKIGSHVLIGIGAKILPGAQIQDWVIVAAGAVVTPGANIQSGCMVAGVPGVVSGSLEPRHRNLITMSAEAYAKLGQSYRKLFQP